MLIVRLIYEGHTHEYRETTIGEFKSFHRASHENDFRVGATLYPADCLGLILLSLEKFKKYEFFIVGDLIEINLSERRKKS